jgi:hypothetical protein
MSMVVELAPRRRLKNINVFEVSLVDKAANGQKFLVFKRFEGGGDNMDDKNTGIKKNKNGNSGELQHEIDSSARLSELSEMLEKEKSAKITKQNDVGDEDSNNGFDDDFDDDNEGEDMKIVELRKEIDELREHIEQLKRSIPIRKGLQECDDKRERMGIKDKTAALLKSREMRAKMTHASAPNPADWAKELLQ